MIYMSGKQPSYFYEENKYTENNFKQHNRKWTKCGWTHKVIVKNGVLRKNGLNSW